MIGRVVMYTVGTTGVVGALTYSGLPQKMVSTIFFTSSFARYIGSSVEPTKDWTAVPLNNYKQGAQILVMSRNHDYDNEDFHNLEKYNH